MEDQELEEYLLSAMPTLGDDDNVTTLTVAKAAFLLGYSLSKEENLSNFKDKIEEIIPLEDEVHTSSGGIRPIVGPSNTVK